MLLKGMAVGVGVLVVAGFVGCDALMYDGTTPLPQEVAAGRAAQEQTTVAAPAEQAPEPIQPITVQEESSDFAEVEAVPREPVRAPRGAVGGGGPLVGEYLTGIQMQNELQKSAGQSDAASRAAGLAARERARQAVRQHDDAIADTLAEHDTGYAGDFER